MTRPAALPLLVLLLALTACSYVGVPLGSPTPRNALGTPVAQLDASQVENTQEPAQTATAEPTAAPTVDIAPLLTQIAASNQQAADLAKKLDNQAAEIARANADTANANAQTAKHNDAQRAKDVDIANAITTQKIAEAANNEALAEIEKAQARTKEANAQLVNSLCILAVTVSLVLLAVRAMRRYQVVMLPAPESVTVHSPEIMRPFVPTGPTSTSSRPLPVDAEIMYRFMTWATQGKPLGSTNIERNGVLKSTERSKRTDIITYLQDLQHIEYRGELVLTDNAVTYWLDWMQLYRPTPDAQIVKSAAVTRPDYGKHGHDGAGGDVYPPESSDDVVK